MLNRTRIALAALAIVALGGLARSEYSPIRGIMGPNSSGVGNVSCWGDLFGLSLTDCGAFPVIPTTNVGTVATNAALKALTGGLYSTVIRTGYLAANDSPGAAYTWNAGSACTDDGGSCIAPNIGSGRWLLVPPHGPVHVGIFGAMCTNVGGTDDQPAIQAAINYAQGLVNPNNGIQLPGSTCRFPTLGVTVTGNLSIRGYGQSLSTINVIACTITAINFNGTNANATWILRDLSINYPNPPACQSSGGAAVIMGNDLRMFTGSIVDNVGIFSANSGIYFNNGTNYAMLNSHIQKVWIYGIRIASVLLPDAGGVTIFNNQIEANAITTGASIRWESSGGILVKGNKLFGSNFSLDFAMTNQTSEFHFVDNLIANPSTAAISLTRTASNLVMTEMLITGNIVDGANRTLYVPSDAFINPVSWMQNITFANNQISSLNNASANQVTLYQTSGFNVSNNLFKCNGTCTGGRPIFVDASSDKGLIVQSTNSEIGAWSAADSISSTNTTNAATTGGQTKVCTVLPTVTNGVVTAC